MFFDDSNYYYEVDMAEKIGRDFNKILSSETMKQLERMMISTTQTNVSTTSDYTNPKSRKKHCLFPPKSRADKAGLISLENLLKTEGKLLGNLKYTLEMHPAANICSINFTKSSYSDQFVCIDLVKQDSITKNQTVIWSKMLPIGSARKLWNDLRSIKWQI